MTLELEFSFCWSKVAISCSEILEMTKMNTKYVFYFFFQLNRGGPFVSYFGRKTHQEGVAFVGIATCLLGWGGGLPRDLHPKIQTPSLDQMHDKRRCDLLVGG